MEKYKTKKKEKHKAVIHKEVNMNLVLSMT